MGKFRGIMMATLAGAVLVPPAAFARTKAAQICWVEYSYGEVPGAMSAAGATAQVWHNTASGMLIRHRSGHVLIDAGWSKAAMAQMAELSPLKRPLAERSLGLLSWRKTAPEGLAAVSEAPAKLRYILPTHGHYDHLAGAEDLPRTSILMSSEEIAYLDGQARTADIVPASNIAAVRPRMRPIQFRDRPYLGFAKSHDLFGDGAIVVVPLPGHTPGSIGVFVTVGGKRVFHVGDAAFVSEAISAGLPKIDMLRSFLDTDGLAADGQVKALQAFQRRHPDILLLPAHDRTAWQAAFGGKPGCTTG